MSYQMDELINKYDIYNNPDVYWQKNRLHKNRKMRKIKFKKKEIAWKDGGK